MLLVMLAIACMGEDRFQARYDEEVCLWRQDCFGDDLGECLDDAAEDWQGSKEGCDFDRRAAKECLKDLQYMDCPTETWDAGFPFACADVWDC